MVKLSHFPCDIDVDNSDHGLQTVHCTYLAEVRIFLTTKSIRDNREYFMTFHYDLKMY
jgi:hypothetical protein